MDLRTDDLFRCVFSGVIAVPFGSEGSMAFAGDEADGWVYGLRFTILHLKTQLDVWDLGTGKCCFTPILRLTVFPFGQEHVQKSVCVCVCECARSQIVFSAYVGRDRQGMFVAS